MPDAGQLPIPTGLSRQFEPVASARTGAARLGTQVGSNWTPAGLGDTQVDPERGHATYLAYRDALRSPEKPGIRESYGAMREHVNTQYDHMTKPTEQGGLGIKHEVVPHDPYSGPGEMADDVRKGNIKTFASTSTGEHEFFSSEENDKFRAVHDVFGHAAIGRGFSRHGEEAAYQSHAQTFPKEALPALASETRGQNSYLNYGPGGFASQEGKVVGLPDWAHDDSKPITPRSPYKNPSRTAPIRYKQDTLF